MGVSDLDKKILLELSESISLKEIQASLSESVVFVSKKKTFPKFIQRLNMFETDDLIDIEDFASLTENKKISTAACGATAYNLLTKIWENSSESVWDTAFEYMCEDPLPKKYFDERSQFQKSLAFLKEFLRRWSGRGFPKEPIQKIEFDELLNFVGPNVRKMNKYFSSALLSLFQGRPELSLYFSTLAANVADKLDLDEKIEIHVTEALFYKYLKSSFAEEKWISVCKLVDDLPNWIRVGESRSVVKKVVGEGYFLEKVILCKESENLDDLIAEADLADFLDSKFIRTTTPLYIEQPDSRGFYKYFLVCIEGKLLLDYLNEDNKKYISSCIDAIQRVHFTVPNEKVRFGKLDLRKSVEERFQNPNLPLSKSIINKLRSWYDFIIPFFESEPDLWRYSMDSHPENILIDVWGRVNIIDTENKYLAPVVFDLANLFGYGKYFSYYEKAKGAEQYFSSLKRKSINISSEKFDLLFWNSMIHRSYFLCSAWSDPLRSSLHEERDDLIDNALDAIDCMKKDYELFYDTHKNIYSNLEQGLIEVKDAL